MKKLSYKSRPQNLYQMLNLTSDPLFNVKLGHLTTKPLLLLILRQEIMAAVVVLF